MDRNDRSGVEKDGRFEDFTRVHKAERKCPDRDDVHANAGVLRIETTDEGTILRVVSPIYYSEDCLACHGIPKGILDISGYPREGAQEGELAGAISVHIPLKGTH